MPILAPFSMNISHTNLKMSTSRGQRRHRVVIGCSGPVNVSTIVDEELNDGVVSCSGSLHEWGMTCLGLVIQLCTVVQTDLHHCGVTILLCISESHVPSLGLSMHLDS